MFDIEKIQLRAKIFEPKLKLRWCRAQDFDESQIRLTTGDFELNVTLLSTVSKGLYEERSEARFSSDVCVRTSHQILFFVINLSRLLHCVKYFKTMKYRLGCNDYS